jgi:hypothetical protein
VEDLFRILSARAAYPVRGSDPSSHERLGLSENQAGRILVRGGAGLPLLDLLIGGSDAAGREVYMRKNGQNEIRSGEDKLSAYITGPETSWYRLGLFAESPTPPDAAMVQRVTVYPLPPEEEDGVPPESPPPEPSEPMVISRSGAGWTIEGMDDETVDAQRVDSYVRGILEAEGDNFIPGLSAATAGFSDGRILVELGNGSSLTINVGIQPEGQKAATASGSPYVYTLADWTVTRLFREQSYFVQ